MRRITTLSLLAAFLAAGSVPLLAQGAAQPDAQANPGQEQAAASPAPNSPGARRQAPDKPTETVVVLLPVEQAGDRLGNGCWVRFYDGKGYKGTNLTLVGPADMPKMEVPGSLWHDWDSVVVGPRATVTTFDNERYRDRTARLNPGAHIADLHASKLGWFDDVQSARVNCG